ncbi:MAG: tRNA (N6-isopentenyl adenosine(37)-C2)-methylthiotransferase MiaB [Ferrovum sp. 37-45-19]|nr:MAG: tRNA (N6-isopentenyl adenosine(37)-C2)-methylthiotransferase MiaB [Ferrovum sp. 21-44-67]OYV94733.1 MAG: tRNA (N6-isopentenyl adenosine(37)-C2)-methylthiotransferase MiaB [Ferrovum sp. 37-45-19]OZB31871.1 MAG: tRNA (N6-isopentenyl adenosine(37)-C2)-methylthiotransferase MiaB [Ferrovum sp. 34-44-207]HQT81151.1 tRNA (N6-isopentenyl adenosine(37)-C2)-methylthiotransferase MiaB [Ferrovaceae bacterium]HQU06032.1 tRNA (N6-isopentenyl adenosine(37)-C2)-methylthiotransferase MiaB [Ferrovaceae b
MTKKVFIRTFGCQMNEYDSEKMADLLHATHHFVRTDSPDNADVVILNTCSVREKAEDKVYSDLGRLNELKQIKPNLIIAVGGCVASQEGETIIERAPYVDVVFGPQTLHRLPDLILAKETTGQSQMDISFPEIEKFDALPTPEAKGPTAYVSIMEGCSKYCTFCVVPYTRGEEFSRPAQDIVNEIEALVDQGVKEITLLGQNVNAWQTLDEAGNDLDFTWLIEQIHPIDQLQRIRFTTSHPLEFSDRLIDAFGRLPKLMNQVHLPVQSGSDKILAQMKRGYTAKQYIEIINKLKQACPSLSISSDFIIGFPGETEEDFQATLDLIDEVQFDGSYAFIYSPRPGTPAAKLVDNVSAEQKKSRLSRLLQKTDSAHINYSQHMVDTVQDVLVDGFSKRDSTQLRGKTSNNRVINFTGHPRLIGQIIPVKISSIAHFSLRGEVVTSS